MIYDEGSTAALPATHGIVHIGTFAYLDKKGFGLGSKFSLDDFQEGRTVIMHC